MNTDRNIQISRAFHGGRPPGAGSTKSPEDAGAQRPAAAADLQSRGARAFVAWKQGRSGGTSGQWVKMWFYMVLVWTTYGFTMG